MSNQLEKVKELIELRAQARLGGGAKARQKDTHLHGDIQQDLMLGLVDARRREFIPERGRRRAHGLHLHRQLRPPACQQRRACQRTQRHRQLAGGHLPQPFQHIVRHSRLQAVELRHVAAQRRHTAVAVLVEAHQPPVLHPALLHGVVHRRHHDAADGVGAARRGQLHQHGAQVQQDRRQQPRDRYQHHRCPYAHPLPPRQPYIPQPSHAATPSQGSV
mgnify:CR=1 FL=1